ncbi:hypothetical protein V6N13_109620 [Hibiscus sabdariffa]
MLRYCIIDFQGSWEKQLPLVEFAYNNSYQASIQMAPYEALYGRRCRTPVCWAEAGQKLLPLPDILKGTTEKVKLIRERLKAASDRHKSYADLKRREIEYAVGDRVFLKVSPWKKVMRFGRKGKLSPRFIGPYEIVERVGPVAYRLLLPPELQKIHNVFHVSMLRRYRSDPSHVMPVEEIELNPDLSYDEEPVEILASDSKVLQGRTIELVKVKWRHRGVEEATWERKEDMMEQFPYLFPSGENRLSVLLEGVSITSLVEARRQEDQGINFCSRLCRMDFGEPCVFSSSDFCISGLEYRYALVVPVPRFLAGIRVSIRLGEYRYSLELVPVPFESRIGTARPNLALYRYSRAYRYPNSSLEF